MSYLKLVSGSDIRGNAETDLSNHFLEQFSFVLARHLLKDHRKSKVVIGKDSRISGPRIEKALVDFLSKYGVDTIVFQSKEKWNHVSTTPMVFSGTRHYEADLGIMITASHLPSPWNGLKIFTNEDVFPKTTLKELLGEADRISITHTAQRQGNVQYEKYYQVYCSEMVDFVRNKISHPQNYDQPLQGLNILVDSGNGATGFFPSEILQPLGANTDGSLYLDPDGTFPNHVPNPEQPEAVKDLCQAVVDKKAELGIIFDTDGDRSAVVLPNGEPAIQNRLLALVSAMVLEEYPGSYVVTDSVTSDGLTDFIKEKGGIHHRFKRGYANVKKEMQRLNEEKVRCYTGGETSGHIMFTENFYADDGSYTIAKFLIYLSQLKTKGQDFSTILSSLKEPAESTSVRLTIDLDDFKDYGLNVIDHFIQWAEQKELYIDTTEGIRFNTNELGIPGWVLVRLSLHEPLLVVNMESDIQGGLEKIKELLKSHFENFQSVDLSKL